jgi:2-(1,2-epoxy-1,2-dihydrophenyl)acetyl-CoA isomerase
VNGAAAGTGASLALSADIVLAAESSYFLLAFVNIGLVPDAGASWLLPRTIGAPRFTAMAMLGKRIPGRQAAEWGMIWDCVADDKLMAEAMATARQLAAGPTKTLSLIKQLIQQSDRNDYEGQMVLEAQLQQVASHTADSQEAVRAFLEKRKPVFTGR